VFLVLAGAFLAAYPLTDEIRAFIGDLKAAPLFDWIYYPAPSSPHPFLYLIVRNFAIAWSAWLALLMVVQLVSKDRTGRVAQTLGDCVFWVGAACLLEKIRIGEVAYGSFLALLVVVAGLSMITRALALERIRH
jgi:hypothetical protein